MGVEALLTVLIAGVIGHASASLLIPSRSTAPPARLLRTNVSDKSVPAVLGEPLTLGALVALAAVGGAWLLGWEPAEPRRLAAAALAIVVMWAAGALDDRRGDERSRGFSGHLGALKRGVVTGGTLKIAAGVLAGAVAGIVLFPDDLWSAAATLLLVALGANTVNLFDRAPGRAGKVTLLTATPLMAFGDVGWAIAAAGAIGALLACLPWDLGERAMLGDAGANPLGAILGLGLAVSLDDGPRWGAVVALVAVNLASERWSFSAAIARTHWLHRLDQWGRR